MKISKESFCHTCRRQRLRCDAIKPTCNKCATRGVECLGYGAQPILWVLPQTHAPAGSRDEAHDRVDSSSSSSNSSSTQDLAIRVTTGKKRGRPRLRLMSQRADAKPMDTQIRLRQDMPKTDTARTICLPRTRNLNPVGYEADRLTIHCIQYYNDYICPDLALMDNPANPHRLPVEYWVYLPEMMLDMVISAALTTQVIRSHAGQGLLTYKTNTNEDEGLKCHRLGAVNHPSMPTIYKHQRNTLKSLSAELSSPQAKYSDTVLSLVVTLMRCEIQQSAFGAWPVHLEAARTIIAHRGGFVALAEAGRGNLNFILSEFMLIDVMSTTLTPTGLLDAKTVKQLEYIPELPILYKDGLTSGFPCPSELLECLIRMNHARYLNSVSLADTSHVHGLAEELILEIFSFCPKAWADKLYPDRIQRLPVLSPSQGSSNDSTTMDGEDSRSTCTAHATPMLPETSSSAMSASLAGNLKRSWEDLATAFQASVLLYCLQTLFLFRQPQPQIPNIFAQLDPAHGFNPIITNTETLRHHTLKSLLGAIHRLWAIEPKDPASWCGKFLMWPMFVAGMELDSHPETPEERQFLCSSLGKLSDHLGDLSPLDAAAMLGATYARSKRAAATGSIAYGPWVDRMSWTGARGLFFL